MTKSLSPVSWQAQEYLTMEHHAGWYVGLAVVGIGLSALAIWFRGWTFLALIIVSIIAILVFSLRPPRVISYHIDNKGIKEGATFHPYSNFRAFGITKDGEHYSAVLIPKKRLGLQVKIYFPEGSGEGIVDHLGNHLPMEEVRPDLLDKLVKFLRI